MSRFRSLAVMTCVSGLVAVGAPSAAAAPSPPGIAVGPIEAAHGFSLIVSDSTCTAQGSDLTITFFRGRSLSVTHHYSGGPSKCKLSGLLGSGSLSGNWGGLARIKLGVRQPGRPSNVRTPPGCSGSGGIARSAVVTGTVKVAIHPGVFGRFNLHRAKASLRAGENESCSAPSSADIASYGTFGRLFLNAVQPTQGPRSVQVSETVKLSGAIKDDFVLEAVGGSSVFNAAPDLSSATIGGAGSSLTGSLAFTALPPCSSGLEARNGAFTGNLVVRDPVLGTLKLSGSRAAGAAIARGPAVPGACNAGWKPPSPRFTHFCSVPGFCSVSKAPSDMFFDASDPGSGSIVSESWNFGDGSPVVSGPVGGSIGHAYAQPGTYLVTLTITDGQGLQYTATGFVYVGA